MSDDLERAVAAAGWVVVTEPARRGRPDLACTVGLTDSGLAEVVVVGLPPEVGGALLQEVAERALAGFDEPDGVPLPDLLDGPAPVLVAVHGPVAGLPACELYGEDVRVRQLAWPDAEGRLPWQPGFAHPDLQPLLGTPPPPALHVSQEPPEEWPLPEDPHVQVLVARPVADTGAPVLLVVRDEDGGFRFLDGWSDFDPETAVVECLHEALERDLTLLDGVRRLGDGEVAERDGVGTAWRVEPW